MDDLLRQIGNRILGRRKQLRMTQEELAEKAGILTVFRQWKRKRLRMYGRLAGTSIWKTGKTQMTAES